MTGPNNQAELSLPAPEQTKPGTREASAAMLEIMARLGMHPAVTSTLVSFASINLSLDDRRFLEGPIVQHASQWQDITPTWLFEAIRSERIRIVSDDHANGVTNGWRVGPAELTVVMMPATMDAPLSRDTTDLYLWAAAHANQHNPNSSVTDAWAVIGGHPVTDNDVIKPAGRLHYDYRRLCSEIRRKVVKHQTERERQARRSASKPALSSQPVAVQLDLF